jgi:hypothetical protein
MVDTNKATRESAVMTAQAYAQAEARARMEKAPGNAFTLSTGYGQSYFKPIYVDENPRH